MTDRSNDDTIQLQYANSIIVQSVRYVWDEFRRPYYLSSIVPDMKKRNIDFKRLIYPETTKNYVANNLGSDVKLVIHPKQRAKIGLIPKNEEFSFEEEAFDLDKILASLDFEGHSIDTEKALIDFIKALSVLKPEEIEGIVIPTSVLVQMISKK